MPPSSHPASSSNSTSSLLFFCVTACWSLGSLLLLSWQQPQRKVTGFLVGQIEPGNETISTIEEGGGSLFRYSF